MRLLTAFLILAPLAAQTAEKAQSPAPAAEQWLTGDIEFGYRWVNDVRGDFDAYRSVVNLGEGPKLLGFDLTVTNASRRVFDKMTLRGNSWGGDPYNTAHVGVEKGKIYNLSVDYRNLAYFNALPSFADPTAGRGLFLNQRSFDIHRRLLDTLLELRPGSRFVPYFAYTRDWGSGRGITDFVANFNEYAVANDLRDRTNHFRGGVRVELNRFHATLEQGGTNFKDHQHLYESGPNNGNRSSLYFNRQLFLSSLEQGYKVGGDSIYSKALVTANPFSRLNLYGQFLYSRPQSDVSYTQANAGLFAGVTDANAPYFFGSEQSFLTSESKQPHTSGSFSAELRLHSRVRVVESVMTDRLHTTGAYVLTDSTAPPAPGASASPLALTVERLALNYDRQEANAIFDITSKLTVRGGHRYVWGDAETRSPVLSLTGAPQSFGELRMQAGLAGVNFRPTRKLGFNADFEGGSADRNYFRTSLQDYKKMQARARYQVLSSLSLNATFSFLKNENPSQGVSYDFLSRQNSVSAFWTPWGGKRFTLLGEYTRATLRSDILYLLPPFLTQEQSFYRENANVGTGILDVNLPAFAQGTPKLSVGGSLYASSGSRPTKYYQPLARFTFPVYRKVMWFFDWRWYSLAENFYLYEGFRTHQLMLGLRLAL